MPDDFRFAVKMPKRISHELRLVGTEQLLSIFADEITCLGAKLGPLLLQLPPSLSYERTIVEPFFQLLRVRTAHALVCEPRHPTWFLPGLLAASTMSRSLAYSCRRARNAGGRGELSSERKHGARPRILQEISSSPVSCDRVEQSSYERYKRLLFGSVPSR